MGITLDSTKARLLGKTFGKLTVLEHVGLSAINEQLWKCQCDCGVEMVGRTSSITKPNSACTACKMKNNPKVLRAQSHLIGQVFERLTVIAFDSYDKYLAVRWKCLCSCGNEVVVRTASLMSGITKSCGCYARDRTSQMNTKHGLHKHPLYSVWWAMKERCSNPNNPSYPRYGGRGIRVCEDWLTDFLIFYNWALLKGYRQGLSVERIDNDGHYEPGNCKWATNQEQLQNNSRTKNNPEKVEAIRNDPRVHSVIAKEYGVHESTVSRIKGKRTWSNIVS